MSRVLDLLIVDDDPGQRSLIQTSFCELGLSHRCHYVSNGTQALHFLNGVPPFEAAPRPDLILLDLNMPGMTGCEVLHQIKSDPKLLSIPVVMLSDSRAWRDVDACYREHANAYVEKPADLESSLDLLRDIHCFWAVRALMPR
jgi:CheY-like chemotaxis protein